MGLCCSCFKRKVSTQSEDDENEEEEKDDFDVYADMGRSMSLGVQKPLLQKLSAPRGSIFSISPKDNDRRGSHIPLSNNDRRGSHKPPRDCDRLSAPRGSIFSNKPLIDLNRRGSRELLSIDYNRRGSHKPPSDYDRLSAPRGSIFSNKPLIDLDRRGSRELLPIDYNRRGSHKPLEAMKSSGLSASFDAIFAPFQKGHHIQPTYEDIVPFKSLYARSISLPNVIPDSPRLGRTEELGSIHFTVSYDANELLLQIAIKKAVHLPAIDLNGTSDPYVKIFLLPDKKHGFETRVVKRNLNPHWNRVFRFEGFPREKLKNRRLYLQVFDHDRFSRDNVIGETELDFMNIDLQQEPEEFVQDLRPCKNSRGNDLGNLLVSMCYIPTTSRITVVVMKGSRLKTTDISGKSDPYVKVYLMYSGTRAGKKKTPVVKRSLNPVWNEAMEFEAPVDKIRGISFVFTVMDFDAILPNTYVGKVIVGYSTTGTSLKHWTDVLTNPGKPIAMWHRIVKY